MEQPPKFASETEEADWWYAHRDEVEAELKAVAERGGPRLTVQEIIERERKKRDLPPSE